MNRKFSPLFLALLLTLPTPALAMSDRFTSIGETFRRLPILGLDSEKDGAEAVTVEMYELPAPLPPVDSSPATYDAWEQTDPVSAFLWAHTVDITTVKEADIYQYGADVRRVLVKRKLKHVGYLTQTGTVSDLSGLTERGSAILKQLERPEIQALLSVIRYAEGTLGAQGYNTGFNYNKISDLSRHPMTVWGGSSAAGAYQFMNYTWPGVAAAAGLRDFTPLSQDIAALYQVQHKHGIKLENVNGDNFEAIIFKINAEWASLPTEAGVSRYTFKGRPQPAKSMGSLINQWQRAMAGDLPRMGYNWYHWNEASHNALKNFQHAYQVEPTGNFDGATWKAVFDAKMGEWTPPAVAVPEPEVVVAQAIADGVIEEYIAPSPHVIEEFVENERIAGYRVSSLFGHRPRPTAGARSYHPGVDLAMPVGTPIFAPGDVNVSVSFHNGFGYRVQFEYGGVYHSLNHMAKESMMFNGGTYKRGEIIGYTGNTGVSTGPHLHYEVTQGGGYVMPSKEVLHFMVDPTAYRKVSPGPMEKAPVPESSENPGHEPYGRLGR